MGSLLGLVFLDTNHSEVGPCVHPYQLAELGTTVIGMELESVVGVVVAGGWSLGGKAPR